jgi:hypothetical protein
MSADRPSSIPTESGQIHVPPLRDNDVLFGRGWGPHYHPGNVAFRSLVDSRKAEYWAQDQAYGHKAQLANEVYDAIVAPASAGGKPGGRFLKQADDMATVQAEMCAGR